MNTQNATSSYKLQEFICAKSCIVPALIVIALLAINTVGAYLLYKNIHFPLGMTAVVISVSGNLALFSYFIFNIVKRCCAPSTNSPLTLVRNSNESVDFEELKTKIRQFCNRYRNKCEADRDSYLNRPTYAEQVGKQIAALLKGTGVNHSLVRECFELKTDRTQDGIPEYEISLELRRELIKSFHQDNDFLSAMVEGIADLDEIGKTIAFVEPLHPNQEEKRKIQREIIQVLQCNNKFDAFLTTLKPQTLSRIMSVFEDREIVTLITLLYPVDFSGDTKERTDKIHWILKHLILNLAETITSKPDAIEVARDRLAKSLNCLLVQAIEGRIEQHEFIQFYEAIVNTFNLHVYQFPDQNARIQHLEPLLDECQRIGETFGWFVPIRKALTFAAIFPNESTQKGTVGLFTVCFILKQRMLAQLLFDRESKFKEFAIHLDLDSFPYICKYMDPEEIQWTLGVYPNYIIQRSNGSLSFLKINK